MERCSLRKALLGVQDDRLKAQVVFSDPQVASVGLYERECKQQGIDYLVASYPFNDHGKSMCLGRNTMGM